MTASRKRPEPTVLRPAEGQVIIELLDDRPDDFGRSYFFISWPENNHWRGGDGVSAQCQHASIEDTITRWHEQHPLTHFMIIDRGDRI